MLIYIHTDLRISYIIVDIALNTTDTFIVINSSIQKLSDVAIPETLIGTLYRNLGEA